MAFKRTGTKPPSADDQNIKVVDELVKKTLAVNPNLRRGRDTSAVVEGMRDELASKIRAKAQERATREAAEDPYLDRLKASAQPGAGPDPRQLSIDLFLREKSTTFPEEASGLQRKIEAIQAELEAMCEKTIVEIVELVGVLVQSGADPLATRETLKRYPDLWAQLGVSDEDVYVAVRKRAKR